MSLVRNTFVQTGMTLLSRVLGFARDLILSNVLGAGPISDAFYAAQRFPNLFRRFFAEGAFAQAFTPLYAKSLAAEDGGHAESDQIASAAFSFVGAAAALFAIAAQIAMPWIYMGLFAGYRDQPAVFDFAVLMAQITMPYLVCMTMAALFQGVLNAKGRFALAAFAPTLLNLCLLAAMSPFLFAADVTDPQVKRDAAMVASIATTVAGVFQAGLLWWGCGRSGAHIRLHMPKYTPEVKRLIGLAVPGAIAGSAMQINIMISQALASLEQGAISYLYNADRLYQLPLGLIGVAVGLALLPRLAKAVAAKDEAGGLKALDEAVALSMAFTLPAAAALLVMPFFLMNGFWVRGAFTVEDARMTADALFHFAWGVPAFVLVKVFAPAFFAREDTVRPMRYAIITVAVNTVLGAALFFSLQSLGMHGFVGLAIATSTASWLNVLMLANVLVKEGVYRPSGAALSRLLRLGVATLLMGAALGFAAFNQQRVIELILGSKELAVVIVTFVGFCFYAVCALAIGAVRLSELKNALRREPGAPVVNSGGEG
jgi:putative peptidoglycan lipid II flippase